jgi:hypothetical protein
MQKIKAAVGAMEVNHAIENTEPRDIVQAGEKSS